MSSPEPPRAQTTVPAARTIVDTEAVVVTDPQVPSVWVLPGRVDKVHAPMWRRIVALPVLVVIFVGLGLILTALIGGLLAGAAVLLQEVLT